MLSLSCLTRNKCLVCEVLKRWYAICLFSFPYACYLFSLEIPNFLTDEECQTTINLASREGLDTSEVQDPEPGINIEPTNEKTFHNWDYNSDGVIDKVEVRGKVNWESRIKRVCDKQLVVSHCRMVLCHDYSNIPEVTTLVTFAV